MTDKLAGVLAVAFGICVAAALVVVGADLASASQTGPRWRRRLLEAGLLALAALGLPAALAQGPEAKQPAAERPAARQERPDLSQLDPWHQVAATWREAEDVASGARGPYPFDEKGKARMLDDLARTGRIVDDLLAAGLLNEPETGLLKADLAVLVRGVEAKRPTQMRQGTCYRPMALMPARDSLDRLEARLPMLEKLAASEKVSPEVVFRALDTLEGDLAVLAGEDERGGLAPEQRAHALDVREQAAKQLEVVRQRLRGDAVQLEDARGWATIVEAWKEAGRVAETRTGMSAELQSAGEKLVAARTAAERLAASGLIRWAEGELLWIQAERLGYEIELQWPFPGDAEGRHYVPPKMIGPARKSLDTLSSCQRPLERLAQQGGASPLVLNLISKLIEADLKTLSDKTLSDEAVPKARKSDEHERAVQVCANIEQALARIRDGLKAGQ